MCTLKTQADKLLPAPPFKIKIALATIAIAASVGFRIMGLSHTSQQHDPCADQTH